MYPTVGPYIYDLILPLHLYQNTVLWKYLRSKCYVLELCLKFNSHIFILLKSPLGALTRLNLYT